MNVFFNRSSTEVAIQFRFYGTKLVKFFDNSKERVEKLIKSFYSVIWGNKYKHRSDLRGFWMKIIQGSV